MKMRRKNINADSSSDDGAKRKHHIMVIITAVLLVAFALAFTGWMLRIGVALSLNQE